MLHNLKPAKGAIKKKKRIARGEGSHKGGTATKGHKGAQSRSGYKRKIGFEGGQLPLQRRLPTFGFKNINKKIYKVFNLDTIQKLIDKTQTKHIDLDFLQKEGLIHKKDKVKLLSDGMLKSPITISVHAFSKKTAEKIQAIKGSIQRI